jgi:purine-binding chemotaxis protein CheW
MNTTVVTDSALTLELKEYLTFKLENEEYGIDILLVQEIRGYETPTRIAHAPDFIKGVINLRGIIVPVVDMRTKFNCSEVVYDESTVVIILNICKRTIGIVVDSVSDVMELPASAIKHAPDFDTVINHDAIVGLVSLDSRMLILLDMAHLVTSFDLGVEVVAEPLAVGHSMEAPMLSLPF